MGDEWEQDNGSEPGSGQPYQDDLDKRIEEIRRKVIEGTSEAQQRIKRVVDKAGEYWQQTNMPNWRDMAKRMVQEANQAPILLGGGAPAKVKPKTPNVKQALKG